MRLSFARSVRTHPRTHRRTRVRTPVGALVSPTCISSIILRFVVTSLSSRDALTRLVRSPGFASAHNRSQKIKPAQAWLGRQGATPPYAFAAWARCHAAAPWQDLAKNAPQKERAGLAAEHLDSLKTWWVAYMYCRSSVRALTAGALCAPLLPFTDCNCCGCSGPAGTWHLWHALSSPLRCSKLDHASSAKSQPRNWLP